MGRACSGHSFHPSVSGPTMGILNFLSPLSSLHLFASGAGSMKGSNVSFLWVSPEQQEQDIVAVIVGRWMDWRGVVWCGAVPALS